MMEINNSTATTSTTTVINLPSLTLTAMSGGTRMPTVAAQEEANSPLIPFHTLQSNNFVNSKKRFVYQFKDVNYVQKCNVKKSIKRKKLQILNNVCGELNSGELTAILGPSGAGKTTLLNVLAGFKTQCVTGEFIIEGQQRRLDDIRKLTSYIPQDFTMLDLLTVEETLKVSIDFKLPKTIKEEKKKTMTDDILKIINLESCRHTLVRHLSGGERKRLSIGVELVSNPPIMFCDEPTSGLDSVASLQVITYLRKLAQDGRIVACVIHQPSSRIMQLFDSVVVMSSGDILYSGSSGQMLDYFTKANFQCPQYYNPADFVVEVASDRTNLNIIKLIESNKVGNGIKSEHLNQNQNKIEMNNVKVAHKVCNRPILQILPRNHNSLGRQMDILIRRSIQTMVRNMLAVQLRIAMHAIVAILLGIVYWQIGNDAAKVLTNVSCIFFVVLFIFFGNAMPSIFLSSEDTQVFLREHLNGWYSRDAYFLSKIFSDLPLQFICPTILISIVYIMTGQPLEIQRFAMCWSLSVLIAIIGHFIGLVLGCTFGMQMGIFLVPGLTIPFLIFSGFFIRIYEVPRVLRYLCDVSFFRYTIEGYLNAIYGYQRSTLLCLVNFCYYKDPQKFLKDYGMFGNLYKIDFFALLLWIAVLKLLFLLSLRWRIKKAQ